MITGPPIAKLEIRLLDAVAVRGFMGPVLFVMFNPTEYGTERSVQYAKVAIPGLDAPVLQWVRGGGGNVTLELFADVTDAMIDGVLAGPDVRMLFVEPLEQLTVQHRQLHRPPRVAVRWGFSTVIRSAVAESLSVTYRMFDATGRPVRATARLTLQEHTPATEQIAELESPDLDTEVMVKSGDTLPRLAFQHYGDAKRWRVIARANGLVDPLDLEPGRTLIVPRIA